MYICIIYIYIYHFQLEGSRNNLSFFFKIIFLFCLYIGVKLQWGNLKLPFYSKCTFFIGDNVTPKWSQMEEFVDQLR